MDILTRIENRNRVFKLKYQDMGNIDTAIEAVYNKFNNSVTEYFETLADMVSVIVFSPYSGNNEVTMEKLNSIDIDLHINTFRIAIDEMVKGYEDIKVNITTFRKTYEADDDSISFMDIREDHIARLIEINNSRMTRRSQRIMARLSSITNDYS